MNRKVHVLSLLKINVVIIAVLLAVTMFASRSITTISQNLPIASDVCVIIDPGHGGVDGGATSCTGVLESQINLEIALRLDDLMHLLGIHTKMIRKTDISVYTEGESIAAKKVSDLKNRVKMVNEVPGAVLISIHQNYFSDSRYGGAQVFSAPTSGSDLLAERLQNTLKSTLNPTSKRQAKKATGVYLMQNIDTVGVLVECGFLSNVEEEALLRNSDYQKRICCVLAAETSRFLNDRNGA